MSGTEGLTTKGYRLLNIVYNKANVCVIVMDNSVVAMTGHQPTPGSGKTAMGTDAKIIRIQDIAKGVGIETIAISTENKGVEKDTGPATAFDRARAAKKKK